MSDIASFTNEIMSDGDFCAELVQVPAGPQKVYGISANDEIIAGRPGQCVESPQCLAAAFGKRQAALMKAVRHAPPRRIRIPAFPFSR